MTKLRERLVKIGAKVVRHGRSVIFQMAKVAVPPCPGKCYGLSRRPRPSPPAQC
jgi:hypothetical protein